MSFLVIGEALVDLVASREDGRFAAHAGGSPYNVAVTLGRLGQQVAIAGQCGPDAFGRVLTDHLRESGVALRNWREVPLPSSLAVAALDADGRADYTFYLDRTAGLAFAGMPALPRVDMLHFGSIASWRAPSADPVLRAAGAARETGATLLSYDPNVRRDLIASPAEAAVAVERGVALAHLVKASDEDLALLYGAAPIGEVAARWCELGADLVVITRGAAGAVAFGPNGPLADCPAPPIALVDTVGAGDSLSGGLLFALATLGLAAPDGLADAARCGDERIARAVRTAVTVSSITCERAGASPPTAEELAARLDGR